MAHLYQITKIAEFEQAQMRKDAERERGLRDLTPFQVKRAALLKALVIAASALGLFSLIWIYIA